MLNIQLHTFGLARYTYTVLSCLCHSNGKPVAQIYCDNDFQNIAEQGAILNFNLLDCHGQTVGYSQVSQELTYSLQINFNNLYIYKQILQIIYNIANNQYSLKCKN